MKYYKYSDLAGSVMLSRNEVLAEYWDYWKERMSSKYGSDSILITEDNCIKDYMVLHWAEEIEID